MRWPLRVLVDGDAMWAPHGWCFVLLRMDLCCLLRRSLTHSKGASRDRVMSVGDNKDKERAQSCRSDIHRSASQLGTGQQAHQTDASQSQTDSRTGSTLTRMNRWSLRWPGVELMHPPCSDREDQET